MVCYNLIQQNLNEILSKICVLLLKEQKTETEKTKFSESSLVSYKQ